MTVKALVWYIVILVTGFLALHVYFPPFFAENVRTGPAFRATDDSLFKNQWKSQSGRDSAKHVRDTVTPAFAESGPEIFTFRGPSANTQRLLVRIMYSKMINIMLIWHKMLNFKKTHSGISGQTQTLAMTIIKIIHELLFI